MTEDRRLASFASPTAEDQGFSARERMRSPSRSPSRNPAPLPRRYTTAKTAKTTKVAMINSSGPIRVSRGGSGHGSVVAYATHVYWANLDDGTLRRARK